MDKKILIDGVEIPLFTDAPTPVTLSIEDIREPDKTSSSYSESIELPYTKELVVITDDIASTNSAQTNFNPNYKTPAEIIQNGVTVIKGAMKIKKIIFTKKVKKKKNSLKKIQLDLTMKKKKNINKTV